MKNFTASLRTSSKYGLSKLCTPELNTFRRARLFLKNHANGFLRVMLFVPFIFFLGGVKKSQAQQNPLSPIQGFNIFSYGNATSPMAMPMVVWLLPETLHLMVPIHCR
jgi:hypothetical protein